MDVATIGDTPGDITTNDVPSRPEMNPMPSSSTTIEEKPTIIVVQPGEEINTVPCSRIAVTTIDEQLGDLPVIDVQPRQEINLRPFGSVGFTNIDWEPRFGSMEIPIIDGVPRIDVTPRPFLVAATSLALASCISLISGRSIKERSDKDLAICGLYTSFVIFVISGVLVIVKHSNIQTVELDRDCYSLNRRYAQRLRFAKWVLSPFLRLNLMAYGASLVHICWPFTDVPLHCIWELPPWMYLVLIFGWAGGFLAFCAHVFLSMAQPFFWASVRIQHLIDLLNNPSPYWDQVGEAVHNADREINKKFGISEAGGLWLATCTALGISAIFEMGLVARRITIVGAVLFFICCVLIAAVLLPLAWLTTQCNKISAAAHAHPFTHREGGLDLESQMPTDVQQVQQRIARRLVHHSAVAFIDKTDMAIKLCGVRITLGFVAQNFVKIAVLLPPVYAFLVAHLSPDKSHSLAVWELFK
eukprot:CAMPEP_0115225822 /NCGR_PEP_ID=MMETSP0270-20121206/30308_1 /TAXON_ID=71861 /ORGANISM="Scrippsiella trochoidea, Strain CCMP3099" /LENGTH=470 /DNA_ID=CAMNT_0002640215 /DNA_START=101 /DNA_END=1513 /DNA_ORIENTATION=+